MSEQKLAKINEIVKKYENYFSEIDNNNNIIVNTLKDEFASSIFAESVFFGIPLGREVFDIVWLSAEKVDGLQNKADVYFDEEEKLVDALKNISLSDPSLRLNLIA